MYCFYYLRLYFRIGDAVSTCYQFFYIVMLPIYKCALRTRYNFYVSLIDSCYLFQSLKL
nr:MAG TPA: hypothetical protein [Caudoviricetes sp.]